MRFVEVAVDSPIGHDRTFSYSVPARLDLRLGHSVSVPFGSRRLQGIVFELPTIPQVEETREVLDLLQPEPLISEIHLVLARWISRYYMCSLFEAVSTMLPPGGHQRTKTYLYYNWSLADFDESTISDFQSKVLDYLKRRKRVDQDQVVRYFGGRVKTAISRLLENEMVRCDTIQNPMAVRHKTYGVIRLTNKGSIAQGEMSDSSFVRAPKQAALLNHLDDSTESFPIRELNSQYGASAVRALLTKGWVERVEVLVYRDPLSGLSFDPPPPVTLTDMQCRAVREIGLALDEDSLTARTFLLHGVTGSGKTEVYLAAVERCLAMGKRAVVLVPEIALTTQTIERFASRFPGEIAVLHSGLSAGQRFDQWWKINRGEYGIVIGSRSAVFSPQPDTGLYIVDEEHEWTFKQVEGTPRYHARDVVFEIAKLSGAVVVMGSATPDLVTYHKACRGSHRLINLPSRYHVSGQKMLDSGNVPSDSSGLPRVQIVNMRDELRSGNRDIFSRALNAAIKECLDDSGQLILFLNRRGTSSFMQCRVCGAGIRCSRCDIALTHHSEMDCLICHHCGLRKAIPTKCFKCQNDRIGFYGMGTQAVEDRMRRLVPDVGILRWDRDSVRYPKDYYAMMRRFRSGEARILIGTQMIAKGLDFPDVTLVGVVSADVGLNIPDYRANERAFQVLTQVAGRAGRRAQRGNVIIQTYQPEHYAIMAAASQNYKSFYLREVEFRRKHGHPPFARYIRLLNTHTNQATCERNARELAASLRRHQLEWGLSDVEVVGPTPAYPARLRGRYRWHLVVRGANPRQLVDTTSIPQGWVIDIDPIALT